MGLFKKIVEEINKANNIIILSHKSPDGDSIGSSLGLLHFINSINKSATICHPDPFPAYLNWLQDVNLIKNYIDDKDEITALFTSADLIFCLDFNATDRIGEEMQNILEVSTAKKIMIDHHLNPQDFAFITVSETTVCSTSQLIFELIVQSGNENLLNSTIGTPLYLGILTDTGSFRFPSVQARTHEILGKLISAGVKHHLVHENLNDNNTVSRLQLQGYAISEKLELLEDYGIGLISLSEEETKQYNGQKGDTDGLANAVLSIKGMKAAFLLVEKDGKVKMSFRSKGKENPVNIMAEEHFEGGGHANAAGGISSLTLEDTLEKLKSIIPTYFSRQSNLVELV